MSTRATAICVFVLTFSALAWLASEDAGNPQIVTRLGLTFSIVESGELNIDRFARHTQDKASFDGHYYTDKAPGLSFLAVPVVASIKLFDPALDSNSWEGFSHSARVATIFVNGLISAIATALLFLTATRLGATRTGALFAAGGLAFATPFLGWSTLFFAHSVSGSLLMFAAALVTFTFARDETRQSRTRFVLFGTGLGAILGYTIVVDLTAAPACLVLGIVALALAFRLGPDVFLRVFGGMALGGILGLLPLLLYNQLAFGSPFKVGYSEVVGFEAMEKGFFGLTWPKPNVIWELLFGLRRGLLPLSPILLLVPVGLYAMWRVPSTRIAAGAIILVFCSFLLINASYHYWGGGWSTGPRHLMPTLPLLCLSLAFAWPRALWAQTVAAILLAASLVLSLVCALTTMTVPSRFENPLVEVLFPDFLTPEKLWASVPIVSIWGLFALLVFAQRARGKRSMPSPAEG